MRRSNSRIEQDEQFTPESRYDILDYTFLSFSYKIANHTTLQVFINMVVL